MLLLLPSRARVESYQARRVQHSSDLAGYGLVATRKLNKRMEERRPAEPAEIGERMLRRVAKLTLEEVDTTSESS